LLLFLFVKDKPVRCGKAADASTTVRSLNMQLTARFLAAALICLAVSDVPALAQGDARPASPRLAESAPSGASLQQIAKDDAGLRSVLDTLTAEAAARGSVRVAVKTAVAYAPEARLTEPERLQQRREIAAAAKAVRLALPMARSFEAVDDKPYVIMDINSAGLARLVTLPGLVRAVPEDQFNWMRDLVQMRAAAAAARMAGDRPASPSTMVATPKVVGGTEAVPGIHPFQVGIVAKWIRNNTRAHFCGGTLVADRYVVTAAHCVEDVVNAFDDIQVLVGTQRLNRGGRRIGVAEALMHPLYDYWTADYDVAVLRLTTPVTGTPFASLAATEPTSAGTLLRSSGWGRTAYGGPKSVRLLQVDLPFVPTVEGSCSNYSDITPRMICAGETGKDTCGGDSGGPLTINRGAGYTELVGIVSFGTGCGWEGYPGVYSNVADSGIKPFIENALSSTPPAIEFASATQTVGEGERRVTLTLTRQSPVDTASVRFATAGGTALPRSDFRARTGTVSFRHGQTTAAITITLVNDRVKEGDEAFTVTLSQPSPGWTIGRNATATVTITDND
jgi:trypsin